MPEKMTDNMREFLTKLAGLLEEHKIEIEALNFDSMFDSIDINELNHYISFDNEFIGPSIIREKLKENK